MDSRDLRGEWGLAPFTYMHKPVLRVCFLFYDRDQASCVPLLLVFTLSRLLASHSNMMDRNESGIRLLISWQQTILRGGKKSTCNIIKCRTGRSRNWEKRILYFPPFLYLQRIFVGTVNMVKISFSFSHSKCVSVWWRGWGKKSSIKPSVSP